ncbi:MAG: DUF4402 domain-containing protein [Candidatus Kapaibacterium sp.]
MKKQINYRTLFFSAALAIAGMFALNTAAQAQSSASASADAEAKIVSGISLEKVLDLNFGSIVRSAEGGMVTIDPNSGNISYSGVTQGQNSNYQAAQFETTGEADYLYSISLPSSATLNRNGGNETMTVTDFSYTEGAGTLDTQGAESFDVGGTLNVGPNQATGRYIGSFEVSVQYQ